jgi:hypothetical protein
VTATIYARVTDDLKEATDRYADDHGMSLASAVSDLLTRGLEASSNDLSVRALEMRAQELQGDLARVREAASTVDGRLQQVLGSCQCGQDLTGRDLLLVGRCPKCSRGVASLLAGGGEGGGSLNRSELAPFMTGIGVALALIVLAYAASKE